jgi:hypothetical protein
MRVPAPAVPWIGARVSRIGHDLTRIGHVRPSGATFAKVGPR